MAESGAIPVSVMSFPTRVVVGPGAIRTLGDEVRRLGAERVLVVTDEGIAAAGLLDLVQHILEREKIVSAVHLDVAKNPTEENVTSGVDVYRRKRAQLVIGLGGGAAMDVAKTVRLKCTHPLPLAVYEESRGGAQQIQASQPPMIAVPTTAGTGSEVGRASVICLGDEGRKAVIFSPHMMPNVALCDAELTKDLPPKITAATGMDALTHALEAYVATGSHPFADVFAIGALARAGVYLRRAVKDGGDIEARHEMMLAATMGAISFQKGLGACHALAHPLSAVAGMHHGLANAVMLPHVIRFNLEAAAHRYALAGEALGAHTSGSDAVRAEACLAFVASLVAEIGLPVRLEACGVKREMMEPMVSQAIADASHATNPRPLDAAAALDLYQGAM